MKTLSSEIAEAVAAYKAGNRSEVQRLTANLLAKGRLIPVLAEALRHAGVRSPDTAVVSGLAGFLGGGLLEQGRHQEAITYFEALLPVFPRQPELQCRLGMAYQTLGNYSKAIGCFDTCLALADSYAPAWMGRGMALRQLKQVEAAVKCYQKYLALVPKDYQGYFNLGNALRDLGWPNEAMQAYRESCLLKPEFMQAYLSWGEILGEVGQAEDALLVFQQALEVNPKDPEVLCHLGGLLITLSRLEEARATFEKVLARDPQSVLGLQGLGNVCFNRDDFAEALAYYQQALPYRPDFAEFYFNFGMVYTRMGRFEDALPHFQRALEIRPGYVNAYVNRGMGLLTIGRYLEGWSDYEWRLKMKEFAPRDFEGPRWHGEPLAGKSILIPGEQGFGDMLMFLRYLPLVKAKGGRVVLECRPELATLLDGCPDIDELVVKEPGVPHTVSYDAYCYLLSLAEVFQTELETIPPICPNQLQVRSEQTAAWQHRFSADLNFKIGITWASKSDHPTSKHRSASLEAFGVLTEQPGISVYSLQKGVPCDAVPGVVDLSDELTDFSQTCAAMQHLDLVITVDTSVAHVAGAMGRPVWILLPYEADWRWLRHGETSRWYPSARLFRQAERGEWHPVFEQVRQALAEHVMTAQGVAG